MCIFFIILLILFYFIFYYTLSSGVHVKEVQVCYIGIYVPWWFAAPMNPSSTLGISPNAIPPPPHRPQCVMFPSLHPCVLIVQHPPMSENMWCLIFCSSVSLLGNMVSDSSMSLRSTQTHHFLWLHSIPWCIYTTFSLSSLLSTGIWVVYRSLLL